ncbi:MAG: AIR synthase-related protein, partial [Thermoguttaceae bacterium]
FDPRYLGNPLVFCGNIGLIPRGKSSKEPKAGDLVVAIGGRTGRDGIHGATFSSAELTSQSDTVSGGAVQIGNAITEKMLLDVLLAARDRGLYNAVTDCGAGGFSSAVGEMGEKIGAEVHLDRAPVKYEGLSYTEIWISEAQERMVLSVPEEKWEELSALCASEGVEATVIGRFVPTGRLSLKYNDQTVADLAMEFLHDGRPPVVREAVYEPPLAASHTASPVAALPLDAGGEAASGRYNVSLLRILGSLNVCSKEWIIRQYDHEVQGGSVVKPLVGAAGDGPSDAAVLRPVAGSYRGIAVACGMNPCYGDLDPYWMAASAIDEAVRNCVAVGADPRRTAILDNFCWGNTDRPETLGSLVRAALACYDVATVLGTPFISGKDSLNNEFRPKGAAEPIAIPPSLLISALGQIDDVRRAVTMDLKEPGNLLYQVGPTLDEMGGSHFARTQGGGLSQSSFACPNGQAENGTVPFGSTPGQVPQVDPHRARRTFEAIHRAILAGLVRACHDLSEGGLAVAAAEMAFAGGLGLRIDLAGAPREGDLDEAALLFSESNTRFLCEVRPADADRFQRVLDGIPHARIGTVTGDEKLIILADSVVLVESDLASLKEAWQKPLRW